MYIAQGQGQIKNLIVTKRVCFFNHTLEVSAISDLYIYILHIHFVEIIFQYFPPMHKGAYLTLL